jgi:hypothetical protein
MQEGIVLRMIEGKREIRATRHAEPLGCCTALECTVQVFGEYLARLPYYVYQNHFLALVVPIEGGSRNAEARGQLTHR